MGEATEEVDPEHTLYFLGMRKLTSYPLGASRHVRIFRNPVSQIPSYSRKYCDFLNTLPVVFMRQPQIGSANDRNLHFNHLKCRNRLAARGNLLFEGFSSTVHIILKPDAEDYWRSLSPAISTRSVCTGVWVNASSTFGVATTLTKPVLFSVTHTPQTRFHTTSFIDCESRILDVSVSDQIEGEWCFLTDSGKIEILDRDSNSTSLSLDDPCDNGAITFTLHPRIIATSGLEGVSFFDLRSPKKAGVGWTIPGCSALIAVDWHHVAAASLEGISLIDLRFPHVPSSVFEYHFTGEPLSLIKCQMRDFTTLITGSPSSSEVVFFPFTRFDYVAPMRPFDAVLKDFITTEAEFLTGFAVPDHNAILQFEGGAVTEIELVEGAAPRKFFFPCLTRAEKEGPRDYFHFKLEFDDLPGGVEKAVAWQTAFPEMSEEPPAGLLKKVPEMEEQEEPPENEFLIEADGAMDVEDPEEIEMALSLFWKNHLEIARRSVLE
jgi:hypothetical protein